MPDDLLQQWRQRRRGLRLQARRSELAAEQLKLRTEIETAMEHEGVPFDWRFEYGIAGQRLVEGQAGKAPADGYRGELAVEAAILEIGQRRPAKPAFAMWWKPVPIGYGKSTPAGALPTCRNALKA